MRVGSETDESDAHAWGDHFAADASSVKRKKITYLKCPIEAEDAKTWTIRHTYLNQILSIGDLQTDACVVILVTRLLIGPVFRPLIITVRLMSVVTFL